MFTKIAVSELLTVFDSIYSGIDEFFGDLLPDEFCVPCFLHGAAEGLLIGVAALAVIATAPGWLAVGLAVGLASLGAYGMYQLSQNWDQMDDNQKSRAIGGIAGGLVAGRFGPRTPPRPVSVPQVRYVTTSQGTIAPVLAPAVMEASPAIMAMSTVGVAGGSGAVAAGGGSGDDEDPEKPDDQVPKSEKLRPEGKYLKGKKHGIEWKEGPATAKSTNKPQGQWAKEDLDYAAEKASTLEPGEGAWFDLPEGSKSVVHMPDGTTKPATKIWVRNNGTGTFHGYPATE